MGGTEDAETQGGFDWDLGADKDDLPGAGTDVEIAQGWTPRTVERLAEAFPATRLRKPEKVGVDQSSPNRFYDEEYRPCLREMAAAWIDSEGPITFKRLSDRAARAHGFQRTGGQIKSTMWAACVRLRPHSRTPDGHVVFWPEGQAPAEEMPFRGLQVAGEPREWREVPHPEKLGLVRRFVERGVEDVAASVAAQIGYARITAKFREEIEILLKQLS